MPLGPARNTWRTTAAAMGMVGVLAALFPPFPAFAAQFTADSLVGYWKFDETSAGTFVDSSGHNNHGTGQGATGTNNTPQPTTTKATLNFINTRALDADGTDDYIDVGDGFADFTGGMTVALWARPTNSANYARFIDFGNGDADENILFARRDTTSTLVFEVYDGAIGDQVAVAGVIENDEWHHYAATLTSTGQVTLFKDGAYIGHDITNVPNNVTRTENFIGRSNWVADSYYQGQMDDVRIYNRALSVAEITDLAAGRHTQAVWDGSSSTDTETAANWNINAVPDPFTRLLIRDTSNDPTLTASMSGASLTIEASSSLDLSGKSFEFTDAGTLKGGGTLKLKGNESLQNLSNPASTSTGTILYYGTGSYTGLPAGNSYNNLIINDGLVGYWTFDEASGNALDGSGHANDGVLTDGATRSTTAAPLRFTTVRSLSLDGSNDYVNAGNGAAFNVRHLTAAFWIKFNDATPEEGASPLCKGTGAGGEVWCIDMASNKYRFFLRKGGSAYQVVSTSSATTAWTHVAVTYDGTNQRMYVNGVLEATETPSQGDLATNTHLVSIGSRQSGSAGYDLNVHGLMDDVRIYNRPLSAQEIASLAAGSVPATASGTFTLDAALSVSNNLTLAAGTLSVSASDDDINVGGSWLNHGGRFTPQGGTVTLNGASGTEALQSGGQAFADLSIDGAATWTLADALDVDGLLSITAGELDVSEENYAVRAHDMHQVGGSFTSRSGLLVLDGSVDQSVTISSALHELQIEDPTEHGLVGYWKFDECQSAATADLSGNGNDGTLINAPRWTGSTLPSLNFDNPCALDLDGTDDHIRIGDEDELDIGTQDFTVSAWVKGESMADADIIFGKSNGGGASASYGFLFGVWDSLKPTVHFATSGTIGKIQSATALSNGAWYHIAASVDRDDDSNTIVYINGVPTATTVTNLSGNAGALSNDAPFIIGSESDGEFYWDGTIDDARIYNRALSAAEVANLASGYYADGDNSTATYTLGGNLDLSTMTILSGIVSAGSRTIDVSGDWNNYAGTGAFVAGTSTVDMDGNTTQNVRGSTNFSTFEIFTSAAQTVNFGSGSTQGIATNLLLQGAASNLLTLAPLDAGYDWFLDLDDDASQTVEYVSASYSNASPGLVVLANDGTSTDGGNNENWQFVTPEISFQSGALTLSESDGTVTLTLLLSGTSLLDVTIPYSYGGTATGTGTDYTFITPSPLMLEAGETATGILLTLIDDSAVESDETIILTLGTPTNAALGTTGSLTITLTSDDSASSSSSSSSSSAPSGGGGGGGGGRGHGTALRNALRAHAAIRERYDRAVAAQEPQKQQSSDSARDGSNTPEDLRPIPEPYPIAKVRNRIALVTDATQVVYRDVVADSWYAPYVAGLISENIARGYKHANGELTGEFGVANPVTYAEILKMTLEATDTANVTAAPPRNESAQNTWASHYVGIAESLQLSVITLERNVHQHITRGEVIQLILETTGITIGKTPATFSDVPADHPHTHAIAAAAFFGLIEGDTDAAGNPLNTFRPDASINRAEAAKLIALAIELMK